MSEFLLRVPDHLGDGVMAIPAVQAIAAIGTAHVIGPSWAERMYNLDSQPTAPDVAVLFKPSFSAAWTHRHIQRRVGTPGDWRRWLLTDVVHPSDAHRIDTYAALAAAVGAETTGAPTFSPSKDEHHRAPTLSTDDIVLLPLSKSQATVGWPHFRTLADQLNGRAVFAAGPNECEVLKSIAGPHRRLPPLSIGEFAATVIQAAAVVGNDSGLAHLASAARRAAGLNPQTTHVIFGSTIPQKTGPVGSTNHHQLTLNCQPCYKKKCHLKHAASPCLDIPAEALLETLL